MSGGIIMNRYKVYALTVLAAILLFSTAHADENIKVSDAWVTAAPPNARVIAGYMTIENRSDTAVTLTGVTAVQFKRVEIHKTEMHGDIMKMVPQEEVNIPANGSVSLQPGSYHLMLIRPESVPKKGDEVYLKLFFDNGTVMNINAAVRPAKSGSMKH